jgi:hypothetical protein
VSKVCLRAFDTAMQIQLLERDGVEVCRDCAAERKPITPCDRGLGTAKEYRGDGVEEVGRKDLLDRKAQRCGAYQGGRGFRVARSLFTPPR